MPQHDYDIANQAGAAFRADLNNALLAIAGQNSGATAPATTFAYQFWADTTTGLLKQRNAANSAWITIGTLASAYLGLLSLSGGTLTGLFTQAAGANIASAATIDLTAATGNSPRITGTVATSAVTMNTGQWCLVIANGAWPLTYNATTNKISGSADRTLAAGDHVLYHKDLSGVVHGFIMKADGTAVVGGRSKVVFTTYDLSVTGALAITGVGFMPSRVVVLATKDNTAGWSVCVISSAGINYGINSVHYDSANSVSATDKAADMRVASGNSAYCVWASWDADGVTLTRTKLGAPTGTGNLVLLFEE